MIIYTLPTPGLICFDTPYDSLPAEWDHQINEDELISILAQFQVSQKQHNYPCCAVFYHKPRDTHIVCNSLEKKGFQEMQHLFWYKGSKHTAPAQVRSYVSTVEMMTIGFFPNKASAGWSVDVDPRKRHNFIQQAGPRSYVKTTSGEVLNQAQKPRFLMNKMVSEHVALGGNVLVVGAGAGGDVMGALDAGCNVVAVESNALQYSYLQATLQKEVRRLGEQEEERRLALEEEVVPGTQDLSSQPASSSQPGSMNSTADETKLVDCLECGETNAPSGLLERVCIQCEIKGPMCERCSVQVPGSDEWLCQTHAPADLQNTQPEEQSE